MEEKSPPTLPEMNIRIYAFTDPETAVQAAQGAVVSSSFKPATDWTKESLQSE